MKSYSQRKSQQQERRVAEELGGRTQPGSGSGDFAKGDVRVKGEIRAECKTTSAASYSLKLADLVKIHREAALGKLEMPVMSVQFQGPVGTSHRYAVIDWEWFKQLVEIERSVRE